jgi:hypothetical protein
MFYRDDAIVLEMHREPFAKITRDNVAEFICDGHGEYRRNKHSLAQSMHKVIPAVLVRRSTGRYYVGYTGRGDGPTWKTYRRFASDFSLGAELYNGLRMHLETGEFFDKAPPLSVVPEKRREWVAAQRTLRKQVTLMARMNVFTGHAKGETPIESPFTPISEYGLLLAALRSGAIDKYFAWYLAVLHYSPYRGGSHDEHAVAQFKRMLDRNRTRLRIEYGALTRESAQ